MNPGKRRPPRPDHAAGACDAQPFGGFDHGGHLMPFLTVLPTVDVLFCTHQQRPIAQIAATQDSSEPVGGTLGAWIPRRVKAFRIVMRMSSPLTGLVK